MWAPQCACCRLQGEGRGEGGKGGSWAGGEAWQEVWRGLVSPAGSGTPPPRARLTRVEDHTDARTGAVGDGGGRLPRPHPPGNPHLPAPQPPVSLTRDDHNADARVGAVGDGGGHFRAGGVLQADQPDEHQVGLDGLAGWMGGEVGREVGWLGG